MVRIALTQMAISADPAANRKKQYHLIEQAAKAGAKIVCTQELFATQYFCQAEDYAFFDLAETIPGSTTADLDKIARKHKIVIVAGLFEKRTRGLYHNSAVLIETDGSIAGIYRKMHIPDDPLFYEKFYFTPGDLGFRSFPTTYGRIGVLICWDQWYPEAARLTALQGAEILFYPTAIGWHPAEKPAVSRAQYDSWQLIQRSHGVANGCFICAPNRVGLEQIRKSDGRLASADGIQFWGQSFVSGPDGVVIAKASADREEVLLADCDLAQIEYSRTHWPFLRDRRIDAYAGLTERFVDAPKVFEHEDAKSCERICRVRKAAAKDPRSR